MSKKTRSPGLVNEETVPINTDAGDELSGASMKQDERVLIKKSSSRHKKPTPITEPTELNPPEFVSAKQKTPKITKRNNWTHLFLVFVIFITSWLLYETWVSLIDVWESNSWAAIPLIAISTVFITLLAILLWREWRSFKSINQIQVNQKSLIKYINQDSVIGVHSTLQPVLENIKVRYPEECRRFYEASNDRKTVKEYLSLLDNVVLSKLDDDVDKAINNAALSVAGLVAISPHPALDAIIVIFRANMLLRKIGDIYGLQLTGLSSLYLFKYTVISAITAAGIEEIGAMAIDNIGASIAGDASKLLLEGTVSAGRMYRLGKMAKKIIRPVPTECCG